MKAQMNALPFVLIFAVIVIGITAIYLYVKTADISGAVSVLEHANFVNNVEKKVNEYAFSQKKGSSETITFKVPKNMNTVCFVEKNNQMIQFSNPVLDLQMSIQEDDNLFFEPKEFSPKDIKGFTIDENPLCITVVDDTVSLKFESMGNKTKISAVNTETIQKSKCSSLIYNGNENDKVDIAFLGFGYADNLKLSNDAWLYISQIFEKIPPLNDSKSKFNFYLVNEPTSDCEITYYIKCNNQEIKKAASVCPADYIIVLAERSELADFASPVRSSAISDIAKINTADDPLVLAHEFGHLFGGLADEYVDDTYYSTFDLNIKDLPNCDEMPCASWKGTEGASCFKGCTLSKFYRATDNSLMNLYFKSDGKTYGPINEKVMSKNLELYK